MSQNNAPLVIAPTVGRILWFVPREIQHAAADGQPLASILTYVHGDREINLHAFKHDGGSFSRTHVRLLQEGDAVPEPGAEDFAMWMPYQKGQAARTQQLEQQARTATEALPLTVEDIAQACHEANKRYCESLGDFSQPAWAGAPDWQRQSAINGVRFAISNPDVTPAQSHENWFAEKRADGWAYGPEKDPEKKLHPCFLPYDQLPEAQRAKDTIFLNTVRSLQPRLVAKT